MEFSDLLQPVFKLIGERRVPARIKHGDNPTDITDLLFKDKPVWKKQYRSDCMYDMPFWNLYRRGTSCTVIGDKTILIGGEHEDYYDPNFFIYNDVIVIEGNDVHVYGYPRNVFPPTDSHRAFVIDDYIWLIGNIGYVYYRETKTRIQVCRLHVPTMKMELIEDIGGDAPPWIDFHEFNGHICILQNDGYSILVTMSDNKSWVLDTRERVWNRVQNEGQ